MVSFYGATIMEMVWKYYGNIIQGQNVFIFGGNENSILARNSDNFFYLLSFYLLLFYEVEVFSKAK